MGVGNKQMSSDLDQSLIVVSDFSFNFRQTLLDNYSSKKCMETTGNLHFFFSIHSLNVFSTIAQNILTQNIEIYQPSMQVSDSGVLDGS